MTDAPDPLLAALARAPDDATFATLLRDGARALLRDPSRIGPVAFAALAEGDAARDAARLLSAALDEARMAVENDLPEGPALLDALARAVAAREGRAPLSALERLGLARAHAAAGLVPPPFALLTADAIADHRPEAGDLPDLDALLGPVLRDLAEAPGQAQAALSELLAGLPPEVAAMLVSMTIARPGAAEARLGLYWLLDPQPGIRLAAAAALLSRPDLPADLAALLPTLRKSMPDDPARAAVDGAIRRQMRSGARPAAPAVKLHRTAASLPDGVGAQSLVAAVQIGSRRAIAMCMLKAGHGVKDAFLIPCASATEQKALMARILGEIDTFDLPPAAMAAALARGLGEGVALGCPPAPGMVDMIDIWGPDALAPQPFDAEALLATLGPLAGPEAALIADSASWMDRFPHLDSWFEDTGPLREALGRARTDQGQEAAVWKHLATRRAAWARTIAASALVLQEAGDPAWPSFAAVARALLGTRPLKRIPILQDIAALTLEAWADREDAEDAEHDLAHAGDLLHEAGISPAFLDGYLTARAISPNDPPPGTWLGALIGGIDFPGEGSVDVILSLISAHAARIEDTLSDPTALAAHLASLDAPALQHWCAGFHALVTAAPRAWPPRALAPDDRRILKTLQSAARQDPDPTLRTLLPPWIAHRYVKRQ